MSVPDMVAELKRVAELAKDAQHLQGLLRKILSGAASGAMAQQALEMAERQIAYAVETNNAGWLKCATSLRDELTARLKEGLQRRSRGSSPTAEFTEVEEPLAFILRREGHEVRQQKRCPAGQPDIFDVTSNHLIECKLRGDGASLGEAFCQLKRYAPHFPGARLSIAVLIVDPDAEPIATIIECAGVKIIELTIMESFDL